MPEVPLLFVFEKTYSDEPEEPLQVMICRLNSLNRERELLAVLEWYYNNF